MNVDDPRLIERIDARLRVAQHEIAVRRAVRMALTSWLRSARRQVLGGLGDLSLTAAAPDPGGVPRSLAALEQALASYFTPAISDVFGEAFRQVTAGADISLQRYRDAFVLKAENRLRGVEASTYERVREVIADGIARGLSIDSIRAGLREALTVEGRNPRWTMFAAAARDDLAGMDATISGLRLVPPLERDPEWQTRLDEAIALRQQARQDLASGTEKARDLAGDFSTSRLDAIARTEVMAALNSGSVSGMAALSEATGVLYDKIWLATDDQVTRPSHADADGQRVSASAMFDVDGEPMDYPGDPNGSPENTISCRCTVLHEPSLEQPTEQPTEPTGPASDDTGD